MGKINYRKLYAIKRENEKRLLNVNPNLSNCSGIYFLTRTDEDGFKFAYIGQAVKILDRLVSHLSGYQWIDLSLKKHGLYATNNQFGWKVGFLEYPKDKLDDMEQHWIKQYAQNGYQLRNVTSGSQGEGKRVINGGKQTKTYMEGLSQGYKKASKEIAHLFDLHLNVSTKKNPPTVNQQKALDKFQEFIEYYKESESK